MRILLVLDRVENAASANALMGLRLTEQLLARDHTVHILTLWDGLHTPPAPPQGAVQHLLAFADERLRPLKTAAKAAPRWLCGWRACAPTRQRWRQPSASLC